MIPVIFMGTPEFVVPVAKVLHTSELVDLVAVITAPGSKKKTLSSPVAMWAHALSAPIHCLEPDSVNHIDVMRTTTALTPKLIITAAYGQILSGEFLSIPSHGVLNIHPSRLPRYRGASPVPSTILAGDTTTAVSFVKTVKKLDAGDIVMQVPVDITPNETAHELLCRMFHLASHHVISAAEQMTSPQFQGIPQDERLATHCQKFVKSDGRMHFSEPSAILFKRYRAFQPWPGSFAMYQDKRVRFHKMIPLAESTLQPWDFQWDPQQKILRVGTTTTDLGLSALTIDSKKKMSGRDFWNYVSAVGTSKRFS